MFRARTRYCGRIMSDSITCPCCGYKTIAEDYDVCPICVWENDPAQRHRPDARGANADLTLRQAQINYSKFDVSDPVLKKISRPVAEDERDPTWSPFP